MKKSSRDRRVENRFYKNRANYSHLRSCDNCIYRLVESHDATWATESTLEFYCDNPITPQYKAEEYLDDALFNSYPDTCGGFTYVNTKP